MEELAENIRPTNKLRLKLALRLSVQLAILVGIIVGGWLWLHRSTSPVPASIRKSVDFPVYYPDQKKLPAGYTFNKASVKKPVANGVSYEVDYGNGKKLVFSLQPKPSDNELDSFNSNYIPLNNNVQTPLGQAKIGAYNNGGKIATETLVSLPTNSQTWIIITAPYDANQSQLKQVLNSLRL